MIGSLFSGVGGLELGLERATGLSTAWQCEYDKDASVVLAERWPGVPNLHDITAVDWSTVEPVEIVCGGFPCQPFSSAGRRKGTADDRWMWPEFARCVRALRPRFVFVENVAALLADAGAFGAVLGDLAEAGYDARWACLRAADVGAPHRRERLFLVAEDAQRNGDGGEVLSGEAVGPGAIRPPSGPSRPGGAPPPDTGPGAEHWQRPRSESRQGGPVAAHADGSGRQGSDEPSWTVEVQRKDPIRIGRRSTGCGGSAADPSGSGAGRHTGAPPVAEEPARRGQPDNTDASIAGGATAPNADLNGQPGVWWQSEHDGQPRHDADGRDGQGIPAWGAYEPAVRRWETIHGNAPAPVDERGRLSPAFVEWMMGFPSGWVTDTPISRSAQLRCLGNACVPQQVELAVWELGISSENVRGVRQPIREALS